MGSDNERIAPMRPISELVTPLVTGVTVEPTPAQPVAGPFDEAEDITAWRRRYVPRRFFGVTSERAPKAFTDVIEQVISLIKRSRRSPGLLFSADVGRGKTSALWLMAEEIMFLDQGIGISALVAWPEMCLFTNHFRLQRALREWDARRDEDKSMPRPFWVRHLFLDELSTDMDDKSGWNLTLLQEFINYRWEHCLPTYVATNLTLDELEKTPGWGRIVDRLRDKSWMITAVVSTGGSMRRS